MEENYYSRSDGGKLSEEKLQSIFARLKRPENVKETTPTTEVRLSARVSETTGNVTHVSKSTMKAKWKNQQPIEWAVEMETEEWMEQDEQDPFR